VERGIVEFEKLAASFNEMAGALQERVERDARLVGLGDAQRPGP
jgi:hypothetical protein